MAQRLRDVCKLREDEDLWRAGRRFVVRDLPWTEKMLREIRPFEFENWAVIALGGIPKKTQVGDMGIDGHIFPVAAAPKRRRDETGEGMPMEFLDRWYPIQVKQQDKVDRPDIGAFEAVMTREDRLWLRRHSQMPARVGWWVGRLRRLLCRGRVGSGFGFRLSRASGPLCCSFIPKT